MNVNLDMSISLDQLRPLAGALKAVKPLLVVGLGAVAFFWVIRKWFLAGWVGAIGERRVNAAFSRELADLGAVLLADLLLPDGKDGLTQINHVVILPTGVFVIETKTWDCWIFGTAQDAHWTLKYLGGAPRRALNPLKQNAKHCRVIRELLNIPAEQCHNLVFLSGSAELKSGPMAGVFQDEGALLAHVRGFQEPVFPAEWPYEAGERLHGFDLSGAADARRQHRRGVRRRRSRKSGL